MSHIDDYVGDCLRRRRKELGLSPAGLASLAGISVERLSLIEVGIARADAIVLFDFCRVLGLKPSDLFEGLLARFPPGYEGSAPHPDP